MATHEGKHWGHELNFLFATYPVAPKERKKGGRCLFL